MGRVTPSDSTAGSFLYARTLRKLVDDLSLPVTTLSKCPEFKHLAVHPTLGKPALNNPRKSQ
jgi:hypothetical protein